MNIDGVYKDSLSRLQWNSILKSLKNWQNIITLFSYFFIGVGFVFQYSFLFLLLEEELNALSTMMGLMSLRTLTQALLEVCVKDWDCNIKILETSI